MTTKLQQEHMNTKNTYTLLLESIEDEQQKLNRKKTLIQDLEEKLEQLQLPAQIYQDSIDFDNLSHDDVIKVIKAFGGSWNKQPNYNGNSLNYSTKIGNITIRCYAGEPPPNCKIEEVEEYIPERIIPAQVVRRKKIVCPTT